MKFFLFFDPFQKFRSNIILKKCFCGDIHRTYDQVEESECAMSCNSDSLEICGGLRRNSLYRTKPTTICTLESTSDSIQPHIPLIKSALENLQDTNSNLPRLIE